MFSFGFYSGPVLGRLDCIMFILLFILHTSSGKRSSYQFINALLYIGSVRKNKQITKNLYSLKSAQFKNKK